MQNTLKGRLEDYHKYNEVGDFILWRCDGDNSICLEQKSTGKTWSDAIRAIGGLMNKLEEIIGTDEPEYYDKEKKYKNHEAITRNELRKEQREILANSNTTNSNII